MRIDGYKLVTSVHRMIYYVEFGYLYIIKVTNKVLAIVGIIVRDSNVCTAVY
jgi:hypothetical protein